MIAYVFIFISVHKWKITNLFLLDANEGIFHNSLF
jgi:hypothetical protein